MKSAIIYISLLIISSCIGKKDKEMIFVMHQNDFDKSCQAIAKEIDHIKNAKIKSLHNKKKAKIVKNTTLFYLTIPTAFLSLLFVDFSGDEKRDIAMYQERITHLKQASTISKCKEAKTLGKNNFHFF